MTPLLEPLTVACPLVKVMAVFGVALNAVAVPEALVTVGEWDPMALAPVKLRVFEPV